jgi:hypothetical protein
MPYIWGFSISLQQKRFSDGLAGRHRHGRK